MAQAEDSDAEAEAEAEEEEGVAEVALDDSLEDEETALLDSETGADEEDSTGLADVVEVAEL